MKKITNWDIYTAQLVASRGATATDYELLKSLARGRVLDAGCGTGIHLGRLAAHGVQEAIGVDVGMSGLHYGKKNFSNVVFIAASSSNLPFQAQKFDFIYSIDVIEHLYEPLVTLKEYYRICKPGGLIFVQTPNYPIKRVYDVWHWFRRSRLTVNDDPTHVSYFNSFTLKRMIVDVGFEVVSIFARNIAFQNFSVMVDRWRSSWFGHCFGQKVIIVALKL